MEVITEKKIKVNGRQLGSTEYTLNIDLSLPLNFKADSTGHFNRLYVSFNGLDTGPEKQNQIVIEHPDFPVGVPVRGLGRHVDLYVDYRVRYFPTSNPKDVRQKVFRYEIPVDFDGTADEINLKEILPAE